jgi:Flp pilus assembly protein TadB
MVAGVLCFVAVWAWMHPSPRPVGVPIGPAEEFSTGGTWAERPWVRGITCTLGASMIGWIVIGPLAGVLGILAGGAVAWWVGTLESVSVAREREAIARDLPAAAELLAACTLVGTPLDRGLEVVTDALGGPLADRLQRVLVKLELGADPVTVWRQVGQDPAMATLARTLVRALESGAPPAEGLARLAADRRRDQRAQMQSRARAVGVKAAGPLAACFLPAFMLIGVVPMVIGVFAQLGL